MPKISIKGRVLLTIKDFLFIIVWLVLLLFIADAFGNDHRIGSYFVWVWNILGVLYFLKIIDYFLIQDPKKTEEPSKMEAVSKIVKASKPRYFEV